MRKLLLCAFAAVLAMSAAAAPQLFDRRASLKAHAFDGKIEKQATASRFKAPAKKISSLADIPGSYLCYYADYFNDYASTYCDVTIEQGATETDLIIKGLWGSFTKDLSATIDTENGTITIPRQSFYEYTGDDPADFVNANDTTAAVTATVYADGIVFDAPWGALITSGDNKGYYYSVGVSTIFFELSANMTWTYNGDKSVNVLIEQSNDTVYVGNFGGFGVDIFAVLEPGHKFTVPKQFIEDAGTTYGTFYTYGIDGNLVDDIPGTGTANTLTSDIDWTGYAESTGYWYGDRTPFTITWLTDEFVWPEETVDPAMYLIGSFNEWNEETQVAFVKDADGKWTLTQEMAENAEFKLRNEKDEWIGAESDGNFIVTKEQVENATELTLTSPGMNFQIPVAGTWTFTVDPETMKLVISGEWVEDTTPAQVYILGEVNGNGWAPNVGVEMATEDNKVFTAEITTEGINDGYNYFSFTKKLAENADDWAAIATYRMGAVSDGDFLVTDEQLDKELALQAGEQAFKIPAGKYNLTLSLDAMTLVISKVTEPEQKVGDVTGDGKVDVADVNAVINIILKNKTENDYPGNADVDGDGKVDVSDVNAIINIILKTN
ncbi:MAG: hypothetical protein IJ775_06370 [Muribaculaceae bacterium]|nr:hypothetical protein [Muribaculaceae bacterium]